MNRTRVCSVLLTVDARRLPRKEKHFAGKELFYHYTTCVPAVNPFDRKPNGREPEMSSGHLKVQKKLLFYFRLWLFLLLLRLCYNLVVNFMFSEDTCNVNF